MQKAHNKKIKSGNWKFILSILLIAMAIKFIITVSYYHFWISRGNQDVIGPDGEWYSVRGWYISRVLLGKDDFSVPSKEFIFRGFDKVVNFYGKKLPPFNSRANNLFVYFIGIVYFIFGYIPLLIKGFNIIISAASSIVLYLLCSEIFNKNIARISFILFTFFPTLFIFSITSLQDTLIVLCILSALYTLVRLSKMPSFKNFIILSGIITLMLFLKEELFIIMIALTMLVYLFNKKSKYQILIILLLIASLLMVMNIELFRIISINPIFLIKNIMPIIFVRHAGLYYSGGRLAYKIFPDKYYQIYRKYERQEDYYKSSEKITILEFMKYFPKGVFFYFFRPFPFMRNDLIYILISFHMLYWYAVFLLSVFGIFRNINITALPIFIYLGLMLFTAALADANEGILLRHRDYIVPFFLIYAAVGIDYIMKFLPFTSSPAHRA